MELIVFRSRNRLLVLALAAAFTLAGCGGDEGDPAASTSAPTSPGGGAANRAPTIGGSPLGSVMQGTAYAFVPTASDPDGNALSFSITNRPTWATFNSSTGRLSGTPSAADVGAYENIQISVSDGSASANLATFSIAVVAVATGSATLSWMPPTQNTDGSPLTNLSGYRVYWGTTQGSFTNSVTLTNPGLSSYVVDQLTPATWYFTVTAVAASGVESSFSNVASKQVM